MALTAVHRLLRRCHVRPEDVGKLQISSASLLDRSKSMKTELMTLLEQAGGSDAEGTDLYGMSEGGTVAVHDCISWARGGSWDGRWALAVCSDAAEAGASAVAALVGRGASLSVDCRVMHGRREPVPELQPLGIQ